MIDSVTRRLNTKFRCSLIAFTLSAASAASAAFITSTAFGQQAECVAWTPVNVAHVTLNLGPGESAPRLREKDGRALYVAQIAKRRGLIRDRGVTANYWFVFHGNEPVTLIWPGQAPMSLTPATQRPRIAKQVVEGWWEAFSGQVRDRLEAGHQPPVVDHYLLAMLSRRLQMPLYLKRRDRPEADRPLATIELLAGVERLRADLLRDAITQPAPPLEPRSAPPAGVIWGSLPELPAAEEVVVEPLAKFTPPECLYVRFGRFSNFLWLTHLIREQGGDLGSMISSRGFKQDLTERFERQFAIRYSVLADLLGDTVVEDLALIGTDLYLSDGAAMGVLIKAKNTLLLDAALSNERGSTESREKQRGVSRQKIDINGHATELIVTPANEVRSYLAAHNEYRFITNSRYLAERFWAVVDGAPSLGALNEFQHARTRMPATAEDTLFAYFSTHFFHNLVSPQYQIELQRRLRSSVDFQLLELARIVAKREGLSQDESAMAASGLLPAHWGQRVDGSRILETGNGVLVDSIRGARGTFLPIPDTVIADVAPDEKREYQRFADYYEEKWRTMDPLMATIRRFAVEGHPNRERLVVDAQVSPFVERKYSRWLGLLGEPTVDRIAAPADAVITGQASLAGGLLRPNVPAHQLFVGILDRTPQVPDLEIDGILDTLRTLQAVPGYLGAWPRPGFLDGFPLSPRNQEDAEGFSRLPLRLWRWRKEGYSVLSFDRELLDGARPSLKVEKSSEPTQAWLKIADLTETKLAPWIRELNYQQAVKMAKGNAEWLTTLTNVMGADPKEVKALAGRLVDGELICPLGECDMEDPKSLAPCWVAHGFPPEPPDTYQSPLLRWFRGGAVMLNSGGDRLIVHGEIDIQRSGTNPVVNPTDFALPLLNGLPSLFGKKKNAKGSSAPK